jgi:hypothetical protein
VTIHPYRNAVGALIAAFYRRDRLLITDVRLIAQDTEARYGQISVADDVVLASVEVVKRIQGVPLGTVTGDSRQTEF